MQQGQGDILAPAFIFQMTIILSDYIIKLQQTITVEQVHFGIYRYKFDANGLYSYFSLKGREKYVEDTDCRR